MQGWAVEGLHYMAGFGSDRRSRTNSGGAANSRVPEEFLSPPPTPSPRPDPNRPFDTPAGEPHHGRSRARLREQESHEDVRLDALLTVYRPLHLLEVLEGRLDFDELM